MPLILSAPNRLLLITEVLKPGPRGIFVPTLEPGHLPGATVQLVVQIADERLGTALECSVLSSTSDGPTHSVGLYVSLSEDQQQRAREFLGLAPSAEQPARAEVRVDCQLPIHLLQPALPQVFHTRNLSKSGLLASCDVPLEAAQLVELTVELTANEALRARARVAWARPDLSLVGLKFEGLDAADTQRLEHAVTALKGAPGPQQGGLEAPSGVTALSDALGSGRPDVLVADDETAVLLFISRALSRLGLKVVTFERGDLALKAIRAQKPRLVMLDVLMPGIDGLQVCSLIRSDAMLAHLPVMLLSALDRDKIRKIAEEAGASGWLQKPLTMASLKKAIQEHLKLGAGNKA